MFNLTSPTLDAPSHNNCYEVTSCKLWVVQGWLQWLVWQWLKAAAVMAYLHTLQCYVHTRHYTYYWWYGGDDILGPHAGLQCVARLVGDCRGETAPARTSQRSTSSQRAGPGHAQHRGNIPQVHTSGYNVMPQYAGYVLTMPPQYPHLSLVMP